MIGKKFIAVLALAGAMVASVALAETVPADIALQSLIAGNKIFAKGTGELDNLERMSTARRRTEVAAGQAPYAIILTCSDSRVPPEILFNKGLGEIFVVRVAGNIVAPHELGSIEYGIEHLGANLLMVLGHERCGAVKSTYGAYDPTLPAQTFEGNIGSLLNAIYPAVKEVVGTNKATDATGQAEQLEECIVENIKLVSEQIEKQFGLDILVCNASDGRIGSFLELTSEDWERAFRTNVSGHHQCAVRAAELMRPRGGGSIVTMSAVGAHQFIDGLGSQGVVKAAVESLTRYLACVLGPSGIRVNCVAGGPIYGELLAKFPEARAAQSHWESMTPDGELCTPMDLAQTIAFLVSDEARGINGAVWMVDHGFSATAEGQVRHRVRGFQPGEVAHLTN